MNAARSRASDSRSTSRSVLYRGRWPGDGSEFSHGGQPIAPCESDPKEQLAESGSRRVSGSENRTKRPSAWIRRSAAQRLPSLVQRNGFPFLSRRKTRLCGERAVRRGGPFRNEHGARSPVMVSTATDSRGAAGVDVGEDSELGEGFQFGAGAFDVLGSSARPRAWRTSRAGGAGGFVADGRHAGAVRVLGQLRPRQDLSTGFHRPALGSSAWRSARWSDGRGRSWARNPWPWSGVRSAPSPHHPRTCTAQRAKDP